MKLFAVIMSVVLAISLNSTNLNSTEVKMSPSTEFKMPPKDISPDGCTEGDVLLFKYKGNVADHSWAGHVLQNIRKHNIVFYRSVVYPDSYVPVLIPKSEVDNVRKTLNGRFLEISPALK